MVHNDFDNSDSNKNNDDDNSADAGRACTAHQHTSTHDLENTDLDYSQMRGMLPGCKKTKSKPKPYKSLHDRHCNLMWYRMCEYLYIYYNVILCMCRLVEWNGRKETQAKCDPYNYISY